MRGGRFWLGVVSVAGASGLFGACQTQLRPETMPPDGSGLASPDAGAPSDHPTGSSDAGVAVGPGGPNAAEVARDAAVLPVDGSPPAMGARDGGRPDAMTRQTAAICPDGAPQSVPPPAPPSVRLPTSLPFSCNPMPRRFIFPDPPDGTPGRYSRCGSFSLGPVSALALSPDGRRAAMVNGDGIARIVDIASQQVVAVLAPPRGRVSRVAFSPDGSRIATVEGQQHQVTVYLTDGWASLWSTTLPGTLYGYTDGSAGAIAFSPDGRWLAASPGGGLYLLDSMGAVQATYPSEAVMEVAFVSNGQRLVVADASLTGSCIRSPDGGSVVVLDSGTLAPLHTIASWAGYSEDNVVPAFRASPTDDLVYVPPSSQDPTQTVRAFKISDGTELPRPDLPSLPVGFLPNGDLIMASTTQLFVQPADGTAVTRSVDLPTRNAVFTVSLDGSTVAVGADAADLLHVWRVSDSYALGVCTLDDTRPGAMALSGDGRLAAVAVGTNAQVFRPDDGTPVATITGNGQPIRTLALSRTGKFIALAEQPLLVPVEDLPGTRTDYLLIIGVPSDGLIADLSRRNGHNAGFVFSPDERTLYDVWSDSSASGSATLDEIDLGTGKVVASRTVPASTRPVGFSRGCPVLADARGAYRSCASCDELPIPGTGPVVSADGTALITDEFPTASLWTLPADQLVHTFSPSAGDGAGSDGLAEWAVAVTGGGAEVLLGASVELSCYAGPDYPNVVADTTGTVIDQLPPGPTGASEDLGRIAYGTELWCAR